MGCFITADDYGMSEKVNRAIAELVDKNIIKRVGLMVNNEVEYSSDELRGAETGLHLNFTCNIDLSCRGSHEKTSPLKLLCGFYMGRFDRESILKAMESQFGFFQSRGIAISYIDTHQHVHIIPKMLEAVIHFAKSKGISSIRCLTMDKKYILFYLSSLIRFGFILQVPKLAFLYLFGMVMKQQLDKSEIHYSRNLVLMPLARGGNYSVLLKTLINKFKETDAEFVTHPGLKISGKNDHSDVDRYVEGRDVEYTSLLSLNTVHARNDLNAQRRTAS